MGLISRVSSRTYRKQNMSEIKPKVFTILSKPLELIDDSFAPESGKKRIDIMEANEDNTCCTFILHHQDHTLGNSLRSIISNYDGVDLVGYTNPHPLEPKIHLRIQTDPSREDITPKSILVKALGDLKSMTSVVEEKFLKAFDDFENGM